MDYERYLNPAIAAVPPSGIRKFFDLASSMQDTISLGVGEPDFKTPYHIRDKAINSLIDGETQYTANRGLQELREEISLYMQERYGVCYDPKTEMIVTIGASEAIDIALRATVAPGDEVLVPEPSYVSYAPGVVFAGGTPKAVVTRESDDFRLQAADLEAAINKRTKALILPYPNNPTGAIMEKADLEKIAEVIRKHRILVISDEIYSELIYDGKEHTAFASLPGMWEYTLTINGFSKAFAMTGWRVGYVCGAEELISVMNKIHQYTIMCAPRQAQVAAAEALRTGRENGYEDVLHMRDSYDRRRRLMVSGFREMGLHCFEPYGAFYVFPSIRNTGM
ncbi:MAG: aminotransferase class I/II-fold pyridoxal phosphate-dependent enzyme, partial [Oscillospiraceae bacterium]|nr:aminotransferase class I/II-fold pyridoxal phosphate-dependent enzyme [Oscillospiraceae bacterium]